LTQKLMAGMSTSAAVDGSSTSTRVALDVGAVKALKAKVSATFVAVHESGNVQVFRRRDAETIDALGGGVGKAPRQEIAVG
jgi:hypothetical protein